MVMDTSTQDEKLEPVTELALIDVSGVRDSGMQALILLARSLDWNVIQKVNNPVVLTARTGVQRRVPTNTSIRMSVFQTHLSSIMLHSTLEATPELMEKIIKSVKPNREQANRLREAVGMSVQEHRRQAEEPIPPAAEAKSPLTQTIEIQWEEPPMVETVNTVERNSTVLGPIVHGAPAGVAADGNEHGAIVKRGPFIAVINSNSTTGGFVYESKSCYERIWEDGYYDYECVICGVAYPKPKGVGSHRQIHVKFDGAEPLDQKAVIELTKRRPTREERQWIIDRDHGGIDPMDKRKEKEKDPVEVAKGLFTGIPRPATVQEVRAKVLAPKAPVPDVIATEAAKHKGEVKDEVALAAQVMHDAQPQSPRIAADDSAKLEAIAAIVVPDAIEQINSLLEDNDRLSIEVRELRAERDKLRSDLTTLKELVGGLGT